MAQHALHPAQTVVHAFFGEPCPTALLVVADRVDGLRLDVDAGDGERSPASIAPLPCSCQRTRSRTSAGVNQRGCSQLRDEALLDRW
ncbi:hypothetical protein Q0F99_17640 [Rathayibacter oskolensis]|uniref:hypothetical protein n=1 Tax=Rathayibacter oskolensis TaxID=1891671 RepID=UPI00265EE6A0|nr:hypothetical protein [Rathayibacter oskolensis]WKK71266.1 hypothetical protein Q0F99_17640 [Rathayibacter oskolensis]